MPAMTKTDLSDCSYPDSTVYNIRDDIDATITRLKAVIDEEASLRKALRTLFVKRREEAIEQVRLASLHLDLVNEEEAAFCDDLMKAAASANEGLGGSGQVGSVRTDGVALPTFVPVPTASLGNDPSLNRVGNNCGGPPVTPKALNHGDGCDDNAPPRTPQWLARSYDMEPPRIPVKSIRGLFDEPSTSPARSTRAFDPPRSPARSTYAFADEPTRSPPMSTRGLVENPARSTSGMLDEPPRSPARSAYAFADKPSRSPARSTRGFDDKPTRSPPRSTYGLFDEPPRSPLRSMYAFPDEPSRSPARSIRGFYNEPTRSPPLSTCGPFDEPPRSPARFTHGFETPRSPARFARGLNPTRSPARSARGLDYGPMPISLARSNRGLPSDAPLRSPALSTRGLEEPYLFPPTVPDVQSFVEPLQDIQPIDLDPPEYPGGVAVAPRKPKKGKKKKGGPATEIPDAVVVPSLLEVYLSEEEDSLAVNQRLLKLYRENVKALLQLIEKFEKPGIITTGPLQTDYDSQGERTGPTKNNGPTKEDIAILKKRLADEENKVRVFLGLTQEKESRVALYCRLIAASSS